MALIKPKAGIASPALDSEWEDSIESLSSHFFYIITADKFKNSDDQSLIMAAAKRYVKYMVSLRCKMILRDELSKANLTYSISPHGAIEFREEPAQIQLTGAK